MEPGGHPKLRMTAAELDAFLAEERVLNLATVDADGWPTTVPVWFVWHDDVFWVWNLDRAKRTERLRDPTTRVSVGVDGGTEYAELRGIHARVEQRFVAFEDVPEEVRRLLGRRYFATDEPIGPVDDHTWLALTPIQSRTWDFRKRFAPS